MEVISLGKVIDVHVHVGRSAALYVGGSIQIVTSRMSRHGITHSVVSPIPGFEDPEGIKSVKEMNAQVADIQKNNADVFPLVFGVAEARHGAKAAAEETACLLYTSSAFPHCASYIAGEPAMSHLH